MVEFKYSSSLAPSIRPYVEELFTSGLFSQHVLEIFSPLSAINSYDESILDDISSFVEEEDNLCDRFKLVLPFAGYSVVWEVIFDCTWPDAPPDFIFDDESFLDECDMDSIPSLINWDAENEKSLVQVVTEILQLYSKYQLQEISRSVRDCVVEWLDYENLEKIGVKVEVLNINQKTGPFATLVRQANVSLPYGSTSVLVEVPVISDVLDTKNMLFSLQYLIKPHIGTLEEKISFSPELEKWIASYSDNFSKKYKWGTDLKALSVTVETYNKEITELLKRSVQDFKQREKLLLSLYHNIMSKDDIKPSLFEFDFNEFQFCSFLLQNSILLAVDFPRRQPRGLLYDVHGDNDTPTPIEEIGDKLTNPSFDIVTDVLSRFNS